MNNFVENVNFDVKCSGENPVVEGAGNMGETGQTCVTQVLQSWQGLREYKGW